MQQSRNPQFRLPKFNPLKRDPQPELQPPPQAAPHGGAYGLAAAANGSSANVYMRMGYPSGEWGSIPVEGGVEAAYRREIANSPDPDERRRELEEMMNKYRSPFLVAESFGVEKIIDPRDTRSHLAMLVEAAQPILKRIAGPKARYGVRP